MKSKCEITIKIENPGYYISTYLYIRKEIIKKGKHQIDNIPDLSSDNDYNCTLALNHAKKGKEELVKNFVIEFKDKETGNTIESLIFDALSKAVVITLFNEDGTIKGVIDANSDDLCFKFDVHESYNGTKLTQVTILTIEKFSKKKYLIFAF